MFLFLILVTLHQTMDFSLPISYNVYSKTSFALLWLCFMFLIFRTWRSEMTCIVSGGALNSTHSPRTWRLFC